METPALQVPKHKNGGQSNVRSTMLAPEKDKREETKIQQSG